MEYVYAVYGDNETLEIYSEAEKALQSKIKEFCDMYYYIGDGSNKDYINKLKFKYIVKLIENNKSVTFENDVLECVYISKMKVM